MGHGKIYRDITKGTAGGVLIAIGALSAIGCTEGTNSWALGSIFIALGAFIGILLDLWGINCYKAVALYVLVFCFGKYMAAWPAQCFSSGALMYLGCVFALPELDCFTNALTGASAAAGFIAALLVLL
ncbi:hypothetical protein IMSAG049_00797 [Clostridiales bacterium]|nr:hypothetical protein IMSAG049_00797 [Clostridiales bacterium]